MAVFHPTIPAQISGRTTSTPDNLIQFPGAISSERCGLDVPGPGDTTGENAQRCGAPADFLCISCGPICSTCRDSIPCFAPDGQHRPVLASAPKLPVLRSLALAQAAQQLDRLAGAQ